MNKLIKRIIGAHGNGCKYDYKESENENEIIITFKVTFLKESKRAMNFIQKAKNKNKSPAEILIKEITKETEKD